MTIISDETLLAGLKNGDHAAFSALVERHNLRFYRIAFRQLGERAASEDAVQQAFLKLWERPDVFDASKGAKFTTWFYRVVVNITLDMQRKSGRSGLTENADLYESDYASQEAELSQKQKQQVIENEINNLPERQKLALNLCFYEEMSNKEAADIMEISIGALESLLMRGKAALKTALQPLLMQQERMNEVEHG
jgi:RNA polymerase sigma-70 factor (ECF subfamily)